MARAGGPGGGSDPGNAGGRSSGRGGNTGGRSSGRGGGGYGGAVGAGVDASSRGRSGSRGSGFDGRDTPGSPNAADGRRGASMGRDGGIAGGTSSRSTSRGASRASQSTRGLGYDNGINTSAIDSAREVAGVSMGSVTDGAIANFTDAMDARPDGVLGHVDAEAKSNAATTAAAQQNIQSQARPGFVGGLLSLGASLTNPVAGLAVDTVARGYDASRDAEAHNAEFGTNVETGKARNIGAQARGAVGGLLGGKALSTIGGRMGAAAGVPGAIAGTIAGSVVGKNYGRDLAMGGLPSAPGDASAPAGEGVQGGGFGNGGSDTMLAGTNTPQPAAPASTTPGGFAPVDFNGYASYAQSFFA